jgi:uncharacterized protein (DUF486 family)
MQVAFLPRPLFVRVAATQCMMCAEGPGWLQEDAVPAFVVSLVAWRIAFVSNLLLMYAENIPLT